jgi:hypothetical protein
MKKSILVAIALCVAVPIGYAHRNGPESHEIYAQHRDIVTVPESEDHHTYTEPNEYPAGSRAEGVQKLMHSDYARLSGSDAKQQAAEYAIAKIVRITTNNDMTGTLHTAYGDIPLKFNGDTEPAIHGDMVLLKAYKGSKQAYIYDIMSGRMISIEADCKVLFEQPKK